MVSHSPIVEIALRQGSKFLLEQGLFPSFTLEFGPRDLPLTVFFAVFWATRAQLQLVG